jgi:hypothetical protein
LALFNCRFHDCFGTLIFFSLTTTKMVKKKFIQRRYVRKVPRPSLARPSRVVAMTALLALGARDAPALEEASPTGISKLVPSLREEDPVAAPAVNPIFIPPIDADLMG